MKNEDFALSAASLGSLLSIRGAGANENPSHRIPNSFPFCFRRADRGIPAGSPRTWVRGREEHCHRVSICRGKTRSLPRARGRASASQGRRHRHGWPAVTASPRKRRPRFRSSCRMITIQLAAGSSPASRGRGGILPGCQTFAGDKRKTTGASEGDRSQALPRGRARDSTLRGTHKGEEQWNSPPGRPGVKVQYLDVRSPKDIETVFRTQRKGRADAVVVLRSPVFNAYRAELADVAVKSRLPAVYLRGEFVEAGGLMTYGVVLPICTVAPPPMWTRS